MYIKCDGIYHSSRGVNGCKCENRTPSTRLGLWWIIWKYQFTIAHKSIHPAYKVINKTDSWRNTYTCCRYKFLSTRHCENIMNFLFGFVNDWSMMVGEGFYETRMPENETAMAVLSISMYSHPFTIYNRCKTHCTVL